MIEPFVHGPPILRVELASQMCFFRQVYSFVLLVNAEELLMPCLDSTLCNCLWKLLFVCDNMRKKTVLIHLSCHKAQK